MKAVPVVISLLLALLLCGCETFHGLGKDLERAGAWIQEKQIKKQGDPIGSPFI